MTTGFLRFQDWISFYEAPINITIHIPYDKIPKKSNSVKVWLFTIKWNWKNRKWKKCRAKIRAYERDYIKKFLQG